MSFLARNFASDWGRLRLGGFRQQGASESHTDAPERLSNASRSLGLRAPVLAAAASPGMPLLPKEVVDRICTGENVLRVVREWRGKTQLYIL